MSGVTIIPGFFLRGVDTINVKGQYNKGHFTKYKLDTLKDYKIDFSGKTISIVPVGNDDTSDIFSKTNTSNITSIFATSNCKTFNNFIHPNIGVTGIKCDWCRDVLKTDPVGIPIKIDFIEDYLVCHTPTCHCSFECAFASLIDDSKFLKPNYTADSVVYLNIMFNRIFPDEKLLPAPDWKLHKNNGGSLDENEFQLNSHTYQKTGRAIFCPVKTIYSKIKNE